MWRHFKFKVLFLRWFQYNLIHNIYIGNGRPMNLKKKTGISHITFIPWQVSQPFPMPHQGVISFYNLETSCLQPTSLETPRLARPCHRHGGIRISWFGILKKIYLNDLFSFLFYLRFLRENSYVNLLETVQK